MRFTTEDKISLSG